MVEIKDLRIVHQFRDDSDSDFSLFAILSVWVCLDSLIIEVTLFLMRLKLAQWAGELVIFAFLYALFRFLMIFLILKVSQGGSEGLILKTLFGIHCLAISSMRLEIFVVYVSRLSSRSEAQSVSAALVRSSRSEAQSVSAALVRRSWKSP